MTLRTERGKQKLRIKQLEQIIQNSEREVADEKKMQLERITTLEYGMTELQNINKKLNNDVSDSIEKYKALFVEYQKLSNQVEVTERRYSDIKTKYDDLQKRLSKRILVFACSKFDLPPQTPRKKLCKSI